MLGLASQFLGPHLPGGGWRMPPTQESYPRLHHLTVDVLRASFFGLKKSAAPGVDEMTWTEYAEHLEASLVDRLLTPVLA